MPSNCGPERFKQIFVLYSIACSVDWLSVPWSAQRLPGHSDSGSQSLTKSRTDFRGHITNTPVTLPGSQGRTTKNPADTEKEEHKEKKEDRV